MFKRVGICFILLLVGAIFLSCGCGGEEPVTCGGKEDFCRRLAAEAETVVLGQVISNDSSQRTERYVFRDYYIEVEQYIINPQPFQVIQVRIFTAIVFPPSPNEPNNPPASPLKGRPTLQRGERVLLFLDKQEPSGTHLEENLFRIVGPLLCRSALCSGKLLIHEDEARNDTGGWEPRDTPWEPLDEIIEVITEM